MKKLTLESRLQDELDRTYHNATLTGKLRTESDFESDLVESQVRAECEMAFEDLKYNVPSIFEFGKVYQWGRGGRTVAPEGIMSRGGFGRSIQSAEVLIGDLGPLKARRLLKALKALNDHVEDFCAHVTDSAIEFVRGEYAEEIKANEGKRRVHYSGVRYE